MVQETEKFQVPVNNSNATQELHSCKSSSITRALKSISNPSSPSTVLGNLMLHHFGGDEIQVRHGQKRTTVPWHILCHKAQ